MKIKVKDLLIWEGNEYADHRKNIIIRPSNKLQHSFLSRLSKATEDRRTLFLGVWAGMKSGRVINHVVLLISFPILPQEKTTTDWIDYLMVKPNNIILKLILLFLIQTFIHILDWPGLSTSTSSTILTTTTTASTYFFKFFSKRAECYPFMLLSEHLLMREFPHFCSTAFSYSSLSFSLISLFFQAPILTIFLSFLAQQNTL